MKNRFFFTLLTLVIVLSFGLGACQTTPAATQAPEAPKPVEPTKAPEAPAPEPTKAPEAPAVEEVAAQKLTYTEEAFAPTKYEAPDCNYGGSVKSIEAVDETTVKFTFCAPDPAFIAKIASVPVFIPYDTGYLKATGGDAAAMAEYPVGAGQYVIKEWVRGDHVTLVPNPKYFAEQPKNKELIFKWNKEAAARLLDLQAGNVNGIAEITADDVATVQADANLKLYPRIFNNFLYMGVNNQMPPWDNIKVRQALAMAIDKQRIVDNFYAPGSQAGTQFVPAGVKPGFSEGYAGVKYDKDAAKKMFEEAGFDFSKEYTLSYAERTRPYFPQPTKIAQDVQAQLAEIGIKIKLDLQEWATYLPASRDGKLGIFFLGWSEDFPDATNWYDVFLIGSSKSMGIPDPRIVEVIQKAARLGDAAERQKLYDEANKLYDETVPCIVLAHGTVNLAFQASVKGVVIGPYNESFSEMETADGRVVYEMDGEPVSLSCPDETDGSTFSICKEMHTKLYDFKYGTSQAEPELAEKCEANADATEWTCTLKKGVKYSNGAAVDAADIVNSFAILWDAKHPLRKGNTGAFQYWKDFFGPKTLNAPAE